MDWLYLLPAWIMPLPILLLVVGVALGGLFLTRPFVRAMSVKENELAGFIYAVVGVIYAVVLGLIAVATWEDYSATESAVLHEAAVVQELFLDFKGYPEPLARSLQADLEAYTRGVIEVEWPAQRRGLDIRHLPGSGGVGTIVGIFDKVHGFEPTTENQKILQAQVLDKLNDFLGYRRTRMVEGATSLPGLMWFVIWAGGFVTIGFTYLFFTENVRLHVIMSGFVATTVGLVIFLVFALDHPLWGSVSVGSEAFSQALERMEDLATGKP